MRFFRTVSHDQDSDEYLGHCPFIDDHRTHPLLDWRITREEYLRELSAEAVGEPVQAVRDEAHYRTMVRADRAQRLEHQALDRISEGAEWLTAAEIPGPIEAWKQQGKVFALQMHGEDRYPRYALDADLRPLPVVSDLLTLMTGYKPIQVAAWFDSTLRFLSGKRPRELLETEPDTVLAAARNMVAVRDNCG